MADINFENITPWDGEKDTGRDVRFKWSRNFDRVKAIYNELKERIEKIVSSLGSSFLRKDQDDRTEHSLGVGGNLDVDKAARVKKVQSPEFTRGLLGSGFMIDYDEETGKWRMELDELTVRQLIRIYEMIIHRMGHVGGSIVMSPASMECIRVEERSDAWRCYFKNSNGNKTIWNEFVPGDLARCQSANLTSDRLDDFGNPTNFYWRLVTAVGDDWIDLSKSDFQDGSGVPEVGDYIVHLGNKTNKRRQGAIVLDSSGPDSPSIKQYRGIDTYSLEGKEITVFSESINKIRGRFISEVTGEDMDATLETWRKQMESVKEQTDRTMMIWFYDHAPSADNLPESEWTDLNTKAEHVEDIFYCRPSGKAYRYMYVEEMYQWKEITDQDTLRALELAGKAQSSADSKIRNFTAQPTDEDAYDVGDVWSNATYPADGSTYKNDMLRCVTAKVAGAPFDIAHWQPVNEATTAKIETLVEYDKETGKVKSKIKLSSDEINLEGYTTINGGFAVDTSGNAHMQDAEVSGKITATSGKIGGLIIDDTSIGPQPVNIPLDGVPRASHYVDGFMVSSAKFEENGGNLRSFSNQTIIHDGDIVIKRESSGYPDDGTEVVCLLIYSKNFGFKVSNKGVFKSTDKGETWIAL